MAGRVPDDAHFVALTLPALVLGAIGRAIPLGVILALGAAGTNIWIWSEIVGSSRRGLRASPTERSSPAAHSRSLRVAVP